MRSCRLFVVSYGARLAGHRDSLSDSTSFCPETNSNCCLLNTNHKTRQRAITIQPPSSLSDRTNVWNGLMMTRPEDFSVGRPFSVLQDYAVGYGASDFFTYCTIKISISRPPSPPNSKTHQLSPKWPSTSAPPSPLTSPPSPLSTSQPTKRTP
jgi:hypothetical protein